MAFFFLNVFTFVMFFQPFSVFPFLAVFRPYRYSAILAIGSFLALGKKSDIPLFSISNTRFFLLFVLWQTLSSATIWFHGGLGTFQHIWLNLVSIYIIIVKTCTNEKKIKSIMLMVLAGIFYLSFKSVSDVVVNYEFGLRPKGFGWYDYVNDLVFILSCLIPFALCFAELSSSIISKCFFMAIAFLFSFNILLSASRNGLLGLITVGSISLFFMKGLPRFIRYTIIIILFSSVLTFGVATILTRGDLVPGQLSGDASSLNRLVQWRACAHMVYNHPFFGVGPGESRFRMPGFGGIRGMSPHNTLIQAFAETGLIGGWFFLMCTIFPLWEALRDFRKIGFEFNTPALIIYKYLIITLIGFWVTAFFSNRVYFKILYVTIALITAVRENILRKQGLID